MLFDAVVRCRWAHAPVIHAASHFYHKKRVAWVSISMHTCDPVSIVMGAPLGDPSGRRSSAISVKQTVFEFLGQSSVYQEHYVGGNMKY